MKRRDVIKLFTLSPAALAGGSVWAAALDAEYLRNPEAGSTPLAIQYTTKVREMLSWIRSNQMENLMESAYAIARTVKNGGRCWSSWDMGHNFNYDNFPERNGDPGIFTIGYSEKEAKKGDLWLVSLYGGSYEDMVKKDIFIIAGPAPHMASNKGYEPLRKEVESWNPQPYADIWIETNISRLGAIMDIPGSTVKAGPVSGIIGMTTFWMMNADACRILARDSTTLKVHGDEPKLGSKETNYTWELNQPVDLDQPIMDDYFNTVMEQIESITAEMGKIRKTAQMVVDTVLSGGRAYVYSRYRNSLAVESNTRRGGLALFVGIFDGGEERDFETSHAQVELKPLTAKDCVIMGITKPDDTVDLDNFDKFRKVGMKIASIGPMTRDFLIPKGRTIPKESDIHIGRICDTYGQFVIPGFEQKVCPTSGAINNQIFFALSMEIIEQFFERTGGDVPGIFANVALLGGRPQMGHMVELYKEQGY